MNMIMAGSVCNSYAWWSMWWNWVWNWYD